MVGKEFYDERGSTSLRESGAVPQSRGRAPGRRRVGSRQSPLKLKALDGLSLTLCALQIYSTCHFTGIKRR